MSRGKWPPVSVVILNFNGARFVKRCLGSVLNSDYPDFEVLFVDNASSDGSVELAQRLFGTVPRLQIFHNSENLGFSEGNNVGARRATGEYIVLLNNDTEVDACWLKELVRVMESDPMIGVAQCKLLFMHDRGLIEGAGAFIDVYGYGFGRGLEKDRGQYDRVEEIFYANGAAMAIRRGAVYGFSEGRGIFDPSYFAYYEDVDLCWGMWLRGYKVVFAPRSVVYHFRAASSSKYPVLTVFHHCKNRIMTLIKNYSLRNLIRYLPPLLILELGRAVLHASTRNLPYALAIARAIWWNLLNLKNNWKKRLEVQYRVRKLPDEYVMRRMKKQNLARLWYNFMRYRAFSKEHGFIVH